MSELDDLMDLDPLSMSSQDIDAIIAYHRNNRAKETAGGKFERKPAAGKVKVDLASLIQGMTGGTKTEAEAPKPKTGGGLRRV